MTSFQLIFVNAELNCVFASSVILRLNTYFCLFGSLIIRSVIKALGKLSEISLKIIDDWIQLCKQLVKILSIKVAVVLVIRVGL